MSPGSAFVLPGLRTPFTKMDRELARYDGLALSAPVIQQTVAGDRGPGRDAAAGIDLVLWGAVIPSLTVSNWGREVWFDSGLDPAVPAQGIVQACATSLAAATHAAGQVGAGRADLVLCGGVESMSHTRIGLSQGLSRKIRRAGRAGSFPRMVRTLGGIRPRDLRISVPAVAERTTGKTMGEHAEEMAREWGIPREAQDRFAFASHEGATRNGGEFFRSLLVTPGTFPVDGDTLPRPGTSPEKLAGLRPAFSRSAGTLTAGNSSPLTDGAAACWVASEAGLSALPDSLPRARLVDWRQAAIDPEREGLLIAPAIAIAQLLHRHGLSLDDIGLWEIHEAFAAQVLCTVAALESPEWLAARSPAKDGLGAFPRERINPNGGSVALGHPFGATGARILSQTVVELADRPAGTRAIVSVCAAGGLGHVALLESC
ncbi:acetyl-CoA C-acyltransferase [Candidatus Palauibacter sp.]|uniref:acetyl-CoA C-acyltransferase n=1 Tax=Candidatus Palauibacter sp. TaxID=3101350 RepID=UPI003AF1F58E